MQEWLRQNNLAYGGLIAIGVALVQPFLTAASLDRSARVCVAAFSVAIPLLAGLLAVAVHAAGYTRLERDHFPKPPDPGEPGDPEG